MPFKKIKPPVLIAVLSGLVSPVMFTPLAAAQEEDVIEEIVVSGYRKSVEVGLNIKRASVNNVDSIVAEDVGKMPDLNLAESIQRVPGVAITREGGEGRQITVRGLGPQYTRVTLNGMEVPASTGGLDSSGGVNRGRSFDFNIFSADLFSQINLNKTSKASIEEGGLASTIDLITLRPMDRLGFNANAAVQQSYNIHTDEMDPRITGMISNTFFDDKFGVLVGVNHSERTVHQEGFGTVRWTGPASNFRGSVPTGWGWADNTATINGTPNPLANYSQSTIDSINADVSLWNSQTPAQRLADSNWGLDGADAGDVATANDPNPATFNGLDYTWATRLPRMDSFNHEQSRTAFLVSLQGRPTEQLELNLNILTSDRDSDVESYNFFAQMRNLHNTITPTDVTLNSTGQYIVAGSFSGIQPRSESRGQFSTTEFTQVVANGSYVFNDAFTLDFMFGNAESNHHEEQYRYNITALAPSTFSYSFAGDSDIAAMSYGFDITDPSLFGFTGPSHRLNEVDRENETIKVDLTWSFGDEGSYVKAGIISNDRSIDSANSNNPIGLTTPPAPSASNTKSLSQVVDNYGDGIDGPSGFPTDWLVADFDVVRGQYNAGSWAANPGSSNTYVVSEETLGTYVEATYFINDWTINGGLRWVETTVQGNKSLEGKKTYTNTLPAINVTYEVMEDLLLRASYSENMARPNPAQLSGAFNFGALSGDASVLNPGLKPELVESFDLGAEWYFAPESYVGIFLFSKEISDVIDSETTPTTLSQVFQDEIASDPRYDPASPSFDPSLNPPGAIWNLTQSFNSNSNIKINGFEIGFNYVMEIGIGFLGNYTSIDSDDDITGLSDTSYNLGVFYENDRYGARLVLNSRDDYITDFTGSNGNAEHGTTGPTRIDFSGSYSLNDMFDFTLEIINLTNEKERLFTTGPQGNLDLVREYNTTGTELIFGVRANF